MSLVLYNIWVVFSLVFSLFCCVVFVWRDSSLMTNAHRAYDRYIYSRNRWNTLYLFYDMNVKKIIEEKRREKEKKNGTQATQGWQRQLAMLKYHMKIKNQWFWVVQHFVHVFRTFCHFVRLHKYHLYVRIRTHSITYHRLIVFLLTNFRKHIRSSFDPEFVINFFFSNLWLHHCCGCGTSFEF